jgi:hypothetical protein
MDVCVQACRACAQSCHQMGAGQPGLGASQGKGGMPSAMQERLPM